MRVFVGVGVPKKTKEALARLVERLKRRQGSLFRWVKPENFHLTLVFLGKVAPQRIAEILAAMKLAGKQVKPFELELIGFGGFPNLSAPRVVWLGVGEGREKIIQLHQVLRMVLTKKGFSFDPRLTPHLTLARLKKRINLTHWSKINPKLSFPVNKITLFESRLVAGGPQYRAIKEVKLGWEKTKI